MLSVPFIVLVFSFHVPSLWFQMFFYFLVSMLLSCTFHFLSCSFHVPLISMSCHLKKTKRFRQPYLCFTVLLMFLWFLFFRSSPFLSDLPFMSLSFYSLSTSVSFPFSFKSFHFSCMSCHFSKSYRISVHICFKLCSWSLVLFMIFLARLCIGVPIHYVIMCSSFKAV